MSTSPHASTGCLGAVSPDLDLDRDNPGIRLKAHLGLAVGCLLTTTTRFHWQQRWVWRSRVDEAGLGPGITTRFTP